jgi:hypothetical protein
VQNEERPEPSAVIFPERQMFAMKRRDFRGNRPSRVDAESFQR